MRSSGQGISKQAKLLKTLKAKIKITIAIKIKRHNRPTIIRKIQAQAVADFIEALRLIAVQKEDIAFTTRKAPTKSVGVHHIWVTLMRFEIASISDNLSPKSRSPVGCGRVLMTGKAIHHIQILVGVIIHVEKDITPGPIR